MRDLRLFAERYDKAVQEVCRAARPLAEPFEPYIKLLRKIAGYPPSDKGES